MILCAGNGEFFDFAKPVGVGLIDSAINTTKICIEEKPSFLLFVGSAGSYGRLKEFDLFYSSFASNLENSFLLKKSYSPIENELKSSIPDFVSRETLPWMKMNCSNYITTNSVVSKKYLKLEIDAENMEFYSILKVANSFNIPAYGLFAITNFCNEFAHNDFIKNHNLAKEILEKFVKDEIL
ncbi:MAG: purine-nucleoside phosphorylase [Campylobacterales bacterium]|jgi:nucleoside phosphorylase|nr:purine-nucleoside phosphorylase [Campylobacterales bacterium]NLM98948.1 purine-nucleoside phosphorylase [Campylobacteraceae bacterium]